MPSVWQAREVIFCDCSCCSIRRGWVFDFIAHVCVYRWYISRVTSRAKESCKQKFILDRWNVISGSRKQSLLTLIVTLEAIAWCNGASWQCHGTRLMRYCNFLSPSTILSVINKWSRTQSGEITREESNRWQLRNSATAYARLVAFYIFFFYNVMWRRKVWERIYIYKDDI